MAATALFVILFMLFTCTAQAVVMCQGVLKAGNPVTSDVIVNPGASCTIANVNVTGSVFVRSDASLITTGTVGVFGSVMKSGPGSVALQGATTINGGFMASESTGSISIGSDVNAGSVLVSDVASLTLLGTATMLTANGNGSIAINGGTIASGGLMRQNAEGALSMCGATVFGGITLENMDGAFSISGAGCAPTSVDGSISVIKGSGPVSIAGANTTAVDLIITEQNGDVSVANLKLSDISVSKLEGSLSIINVIADSDGSIGDISGALTIRGSILDGDLRVKDVDGSLTLDRNNFTLEDVSLVDISSNITIQNNIELGIIITNSKGITFTNNTVVDAEFNGNKGPVIIIGNTFQGLSCVENSGITGSGNSVETAASGQCAAF